MKKHLRLVTLVMCIIWLGSCLQQTTETTSPNGKISISVQVKSPSDNDYGQATFDIKYNDSQTTPVILSDILLGLSSEKQSFTDNVKLMSISDPKVIDDNYEMITGKRKHCANKGIERIYRFENKDKQTLQIAFRAYDNGIAFRYLLNTITPETENIIKETTTYPIKNGTKRWIQQYANDYEGFFPLTTDGKPEGKPGQLWGYPALVETKDSVFILITEANILRGNSGSRLYNGENTDLYEVSLASTKVPFEGTFTSPWRVLIIGSLADIVESTLVTDVSEPNKVASTDWIHPGVASWIYWANNHGSKDFRLVKEYIDLAANMRWPYSLIDWEWDVMQNGGNVQNAIKYALEKGVKPLLWYNSGTSWIGSGAPGPLDRLNSKENREKEYTWLKEMGVEGIKVDFFAVDSLQTMNYYIDILEDAAKHKLLINFHGATIPRGWQRTYPHMLTVEAVYGAEWYNNLPVLTNRAAAHNATLPFTRNVIGSMDYTPGTFSDSQHPHITSYGHELALPILFESGLQHMPDRPETYYALPGQIRQTLSEIPTAWDDTKLLGGYPGIEVIIARRKGNVWYIAGINGTDEARTMSFTPDFLSEANKTINLYKDGENEKSFSIENMPVTDVNGKIIVNCLPRGGFLAVIK